jgi:hypothetical protein
MPTINAALATTTQAAQQTQVECGIDANYLAALADLDEDLPGVVFGLWNAAP